MHLIMYRGEHISNIIGSTPSKKHFSEFPQNKNQIMVTETFLLLWQYIIFIRNSYKN